MSAPAPTPRRPPAQLRAVATGFLRRRPWIVAPAIAAQAVVLGSSDAPRGQVAAVFTGFTLLLGLFAWEAWRGRRVMVTEGAFARSLGLTLLGITAGVFATGGLASPLLPLLFAPTVVGFAAFGRAPAGRRLLVGAAAALGLLALAPAGVPFALLPLATSRPMSAVAAVAALALLWAGVTSLSDAYAHAGEALADAGESLFTSAQDRHREMEALGAQVAHEIKNPLTAIKGLSELLAERAERPEDRKKLEVISGEIARIEEILRDYLSLSRSLGEVVRVPTNLSELLRPFEALLEHRAERLGISLTVEGEAVVARVDPRRVKEAALNLVLNALEASERGGAVRLCWGIDGGIPAVTVEDTGRGMSDEVAARAGEAFFSTREGGTGLGVSLARRVAVEHGGALTFARAPSRGTVARLTLGPTREDG